jgi:hypothetical protein
VSPPRCTAPTRERLAPVPRIREPPERPPESWPESSGEDLDPKAEREAAFPPGTAKKDLCRV